LALLLEASVTLLASSPFFNLLRQLLTALAAATAAASLGNSVVEVMLASLIEASVTLLASSPFFRFTALALDCFQSSSSCCCIGNQYQPNHISGDLHPKIRPSSLLLVSQLELLASST
jgi:hypothetical protein